MMNDSLLVASLTLDAMDTSRQPPPRSRRRTFRGAVAALAFFLVGVMGTTQAAASTTAASPGAPAGGATTKPSAKAEPIAVTAKLVEIPTKLPPDDLYDYAYVMRYEVVGALDKQTILVAHYKPRQPRAKIADAMKPHVSGKLRSFKTGDVHKLQLTPDLKGIWKGALLDEFASTDRKSVRYWALAADPA